MKVLVLIAVAVLGGPVTAVAPTVEIAPIAIVSVQGAGGILAN